MVIRNRCKPPANLSQQLNTEFVPAHEMQDAVDGDHVADDDEFESDVE